MWWPNDWRSTRLRQPMHQALLTLITLSRLTRRLMSSKTLRRTGYRAWLCQNKSILITNRIRLTICLRCSSKARTPSPGLRCQTSRRFRNIQPNTKAQVAGITVQVSIRLQRSSSQAIDSHQKIHIMPQLLEPMVQAHFQRINTRK